MEVELENPRPPTLNSSARHPKNQSIQWDFESLAITTPYRATLKLANWPTNFKYYIVVLFILVFRWPVTYNLRNCLPWAYAITWGSLRGVYMVFKGCLRKPTRCRLCHAAMISFCFQSWHEALEPQATNFQLTKAKWMSSNCCQRVSTQSLRGVD